MLNLVELRCKHRFKRLNFKLDKAQMLFLLGPNGAGKSSLLEVLAGYSPYEGQLIFKQQELHRLSPIELARYRAWLPQQTDIDPFINIEQAFELALYPLGYTLLSPRVAQVMAILCEKLDLSKLQNRKLGQLSGGEQQRVQIGLRLIQVWPALNPEACLLLLDEPTSGLDLCHQKVLFELLNTLKEQGIAIIVSVHDLNLALKYSDKTLLIKEGQAVYFGHVDQAFTPEMIKKVFEVESQIVTHQRQKYLLFS